LESQSTKTRLNLFVDKWNNKKANDDEITVYLVDLGFDLVAWANGLDSAYIKNADGLTIVTYSTAACAAWTTSQGTKWGYNICLNNSATHEDLELAAWDNELTINYIAWSANNPSYTVDLTTVKYIDNSTKTIASIANVLTPAVQWVDWYYNRLPGTLNLVTK
jgi:hypothetical protein